MKVLPMNEWHFKKGTEVVIKFSSQPVMSIPIPERREIQDHVSLFFGTVNGETEDEYILDIRHGENFMRNCPVRKDKIDWLGEPGKIEQVKSVVKP